jgi:hypothetical protein
VSGNPGRTDRLRTIAELEAQRDREIPRTLERLARLEVLLSSYSARSQENARRARTDLFGIKNSRKARNGALAGLLDPRLMEQKKTVEQQLRAAVSGNPALAEAQGAWDRIAQAQKAIAEQAVDYNLLERGQAFNTPLFTYARQLLRAAEEQPKPNGERLEEYRESARVSFELQLLAEQPIYNDLETLKLADSLTGLVESLGWTHPVVQRILAGQSPRERAASAVRGSKLASAAVRRQLYKGGPSAIGGADDPMIELARLVDPEARAVRKTVEVQQEAIRRAHAQIGQARYAIEGASSYPDASGTLRLSFGVVKGYQQEGHAVPFQTTFAGLYERARQQSFRPPFDLPPRWVAAQKKLSLTTPLNFVCMADIIGGNSGSPVVNRAGEFVGIIFDGNIQSLDADFLYTEDQNRAVGVHSSAIIEALRKVYNARALADELLGIASRR